MSGQRRGRRVEVGSVVEDFSLPDEQGQPTSLSGLLSEGPVVLFFYPAALTPGCTAEACHFRDLAAEFAAAGARPVGISSDEVARQQEFAEKHSLGFPLLSDPEGVVRGRFGVARGLAVLPTKRATFVIGAGRRVVEVVRSEFRMSAHADRALAAVRALG
ncbi:peroxiredoxin [Streptomyces luteolus]|uniref:thioredoxin-dependent peroxiredoxin n=1 Tax=Streptomyces luteolus TaxID=3043615 RepID=A0ABT6T7B2_9ACTN|nr:peroxiredoxin [Streptomyces sp. B-S-A12]MDI3423496.1 peroxiredoxin [Streptomyces sp. B-S-A12]